MSINDNDDMYACMQGYYKLIILSTYSECFHFVLNLESNKASLFKYVQKKQSQEKQNANNNHILGLSCFKSHGNRIILCYPNSHRYFFH